MRWQHEGRHMDDDEPILSQDGAYACLAALVRQAVVDLHDPAYHRKPAHGCPRAFLRAAGLLADDGRLDARLEQSHQRRRRDLQEA